MVNATLVDDCDAAKCQYQEYLNNNIFTTFSLAQLRERSSIKWREYDADVLPLWVAEMDVPLAPAIHEELNHLLTIGDFGYDSDDDVRRYAQAYHDFAHRFWGVDIDVSHAHTVFDVIAGLRGVIVATLGQRDIDSNYVEAVRNSALKPYINTSDPAPRYAGSVIIETPAYPPFQNVLPKDYTLVRVPLKKTEHYATDFVALETAFAACASTDEQSNAVFVLCSPHNPTGAVHSKEELLKIIALCEQYHVQLVADEIHSLVTFKNAPVQFVPLLSLPQAHNAFVCVSASKGFSIPGLKSALVVPGTGEQAVALAEKTSQLHSGAHVASCIHAAVFEHGDEWLNDVLQSLQKNRALLQELVATLLPKAQVVLGPATYLAFIDLSQYFEGTEYCGKVAQLLQERARVALNAGSDFDEHCGNCVRLNTATNPTIIIEAVKRIAQCVHETLQS